VAAGGGADLTSPTAAGASTTVELERTGGFAGLTRTVRVPRAEVPHELAGALDRTLAAPSTRPARGAGGADRFTYVLRHDGQQVQLGEADLDPETRQLVSWLMARFAAGRLRED